MLIDIHTHVFPNKIAPKTVQVLEAGFLRVQEKPYYAHTDGTVQGLRKSMEEFHVDKCVVLPIATTVTQSGSINQFAESIDSDDVRSFGSVHPMQSDFDAVLSELAEKGIKGIKLHACLLYTSHNCRRPLVGNGTKKYKKPNCGENDQAKNPLFAFCRCQNEAVQLRGWHITVVYLCLYLIFDHLFSPFCFFFSARMERNSNTMFAAR